MKKMFFIAAAAVMSLSASAQLGQFHIVSGDESKAVIKGSEIEKITYKGESDLFTHMTVTVAGVATDYAMEGHRVEIRGAGLPDSDLRLLARDSEAVKLLTGHAWAPEGIGWSYGACDYTPEYSADDRLVFGIDGTLTIDFGATNEAYDDDNGDGTYDVTGDEAYMLGVDADGKMMVQFARGGFPVYRPSAEAFNLEWEVLAISETELKLGWGGYFTASFRNPDAVAAVDPIKAADDTDPNVRKLVAHAWKLHGVETAASGFYDIGMCADEVLTFNLDGTVTMLSDGTTFNNDEGAMSYVPTGNECWYMTKDDAGNACVTFGNGAYPIVLANADALKSQYRIHELDDEACTLVVEYWGVDFFIYLVKEL